MAKRPNSGKLIAKPAAIVAATPALALDTGETVEFPDALAYINSLVGNSDGVEWNIRVYKVDASGRGVKSPQQFLFAVSLEDLPDLEARLADLYMAGGGFKVIVRANNQIVRSAMLEIAPRPGYKPPLPAYLQPVHTQPTENPQTDRIEMFFTRMAEMQERSSREFREAILAIAQPKQNPPTITEQLAMFTEFQKLLPRGAQENSMDLFQKGMDFASKLFESRGSDGGTNWLDVVKEAINSPVVKDLLATMNAAAQHQASSPQLPPPALISPDNPQAAQAIDTLLRQAAAGVDPEFVAQNIWNNVPAAFMEELEQQSDVVAYIVAKFPQAAQHRPWLTALVAELWEPDKNAAVSPALQHPDVPSGPQQPQT